MSELLYSDIATYSDGIFAKIGIGTFTSLGVESSSQLDMAFFGLYAKRTCAPIVEYSVTAHDGDNSAVLSEMAEIVKTMFAKNWERAITAFTTEYDILAIEHEEYSGEDIYNRESESSRQDSAKIFGFDSSDPSDDTQKDTANTSKGTDTVTKKYTKTGRNSYVTPQKMVTDELELARRNIIMDVFRDVAGFLTLSIY